MIMKKLLYSLILLTALAGCEKDENDPAPGERPEERMNKALAEYKAELTGHANGWKGFLYPAEGGGYGFYTKFGANDRVSMMGDLTGESTTSPFESTYRLKSVMAPSILFDTYTYMHLLADPDPNMFGGTPARGFYSDFEFEFREKSGDTIKLVGKKNKSLFYLVKASKQESDAYLAGNLLNTILAILNYSDGYNLFIDPDGNGKKIQVTINVGTKQISLTWEENGVVTTRTTNFVFSLTGLVLQEPLAYKQHQVIGFRWDDTNSELIAIIAPNRQLKVNQSTAPILPLHLLIGVNYRTFELDIPVLPGSSPAFATIWNKFQADILNPTLGRYNWNYAWLELTFNTINSKLGVNFREVQGTNAYATDYPFSFTKTANGEYTFTAAGGPSNNWIDVEAAPVVAMIANNTWTMDYHTEAGEVFGKMISKENPNLYFTARLYP